MMEHENASILVASSTKFGIIIIIIFNITLGFFLIINGCKKFIVMFRDLSGVVVQITREITLPLTAKVKIPLADPSIEICLFTC